MVRIATGALLLLALGLATTGIARAGTSTAVPKERVYLRLSGLG